MAQEKVKKHCSELSCCQKHGNCFFILTHLRLLFGCVLALGKCLMNEVWGQNKVQSLHSASQPSCPSFLDLATPFRCYPGTKSLPDTGL